MDLNKQKQIVDIIKRCQRNWDYTKSVPNEHIDHFIYLATNSPTKQHEAYYNLYVITNRLLLDELSEHTWGFTYPINNETSTEEVPSCIRNFQMNANAYFLWTIKFPETNRNFERNGKNRDNFHQNRKNNALTCVGISMGIVAFSAASLGYSTGFNKNHNKPKFEGYWQKKLSIPSNEEIAYGLGIGIPEVNMLWNETNQHEMLVGWPDPQIIDIEKINEISYNNKNYKIRNKITYPAFSLTQRNIEVKRFD